MTPIPPTAPAPVAPEMYPRWPVCRNCGHSNPHKTTGGFCEIFVCGCKDFDPSDNERTHLDPAYRVETEQTG